MHTQQIQKPIRIKLADVEYRQNPREAFGRLREQGPVFRGRMPVMGKVWFAASWQAASDVLRKTDDFVRDPKNAGKKKYAMIQSFLPRTFSKLAKNLLGQDGADHRRLRSLVDQAFQRQNIRQLESRIETICQQQLNHVANISSNGTLPVDIIEHYARPVPLIVICELLGLPDEDRPKFMKWFEGFANVGSLTDIFKMLPSIRRTLKYLEKQFEEVRKQPRDGLISALVQVELDGEKLSRDELQSMATLLLLAGHETTVHLISNSILTLMELPEVREQLTSDWSLADSFSEEVLRYCSPIHVSKPRLVTHDMEFHGQTLKRGEMIIALLAAANHDPEHFERPDEFIIDRAPNRHLSFGSGPHVCLGMSLARAETRVSLQHLFGRWPDLAPAFDLQRPDWARRLGMRSMKSLRINLRG